MQLSLFFFVQFPEENFFTANVTVASDIASDRLKEF